MGARVEESRFRGASALTLTSGDLVATFLPDLGMTGVSLRYRGAEHLALPGGLAALRAGARSASRSSHRGPTGSRRAGFGPAVSTSTCMA
jgi:hypothetical protein